MKQRELVDRLREAIRIHPDAEDCVCPDCEQRKAEAGEFRCGVCGYAGRYAAAECACYDEYAIGCRPTTRGPGCFHGALTCPWCDGNELEGWDMVRRLRDVLLGVPTADLPVQHWDAEPWDEQEDES